MTTLQCLAVFEEFEVPWPPPLNLIMQLAKLLSFDLDVIKISCLVGASPLLKYVSRVFVFPILSLFIFGLCFARQSLDKSSNVPVMTVFMNTLGFVALMLYISILLSVLVPFYLYRHPNDTYSLVSEPSVLADWDDSVYLGFV